MATITKNKGNGRNKVMLSDQELKTVTIALANLSIPVMEDDMKSQNLTSEDVVYDHLTLFEPFAKVTKLYPRKTLEDVEKLDWIEEWNSLGCTSFMNIGVDLDTDTKEAEIVDETKEGIVYG